MLNQLGGDCCCVTQDRIIVYYEETCLAEDRFKAVEVLENNSSRDDLEDVIPEGNLIFK